MYILYLEGHGKSKKSPVMSPLVIPPSPTPGLPVTSHKMEDTARRHIASELLQTETNFVEILNLIVTVSKAREVALVSGKNFKEF